MATLKFGVRLGIGLGLLTWVTTGCSESRAPAAWNALLTCTLGNEGAKADSTGRQMQLRLIQLSNPGTDGKRDTWPGRCASYADELYTTLESSGNQASLKRSLQSKWGCSEGKPTCVINQETLPLLLGELSDGAKAADLKYTPYSRRERTRRFGEA